MERLEQLTLNLSTENTLFPIKSEYIQSNDISKNEDYTNPKKSTPEPWAQLFFPFVPQQLYLLFYYSLTK